MRDRILPTHQMMPNHRSFVRTGSIYSLFLLATMAATTPLSAEITVYHDRSDLAAASVGQPLFVDNFNHVEDNTWTGPTPISLLYGAAGITSTPVSRPNIEVLGNRFDAEPYLANYCPFRLDFCNDDNPGHVHDHLSGTVYISHISADIDLAVMFQFQALADEAFAAGFDFTGVNGNGNPTDRKTSYRVTAEDGSQIEGALAEQTTEETGFIGFHSKGSPIVSIEIYDAIAPADDISLDFLAIDNLTVSLPDGDGDGMPDRFEENHGLDPEIDDKAADKDLDGLSNWEEFQGSTNPDSVDTDGDGLKDKVETGTGIYVGPDDTGTKPYKADSDEDTLSDGLENPDLPYLNSNQPGSDPNSPDSDGDGYLDDIEIAQKSDPTRGDRIPRGIGSGLVAYWAMDGDLVDQVGRHPTVRPWGGYVIADDGKFAKCADSHNPSTSDAQPTGYVLGDPLDFDFSGGSMTLSAWFKVTGGGSGGDRTLISKGGENSWRLFIPNGRNYMAFSTGEVTIGDAAAPTVHDGEWHNVVGTVEAGVGTRLFVDGSLVASSENTAIGNTLSQPVFLGANLNGRFAGPNLWDGLIDDVAIWGDALSEQCVAALWNGGDGASVTELLSPPELRMTSIVLDERTGTVDLSWASDPCKSYIVERSFDLNSWLELDDSVASQGRETHFTDSNLPPTATEAYYRVRETVSG